MTFRVLHQPSTNQARCPYRVIVRETGREIDWINQYLDYETLRRLADITLKSYAHELLHFLRWWESVHHTDAVSEDALTESTLVAPSTSASPLSIALCVSSSLMPLGRLLPGFSRRTGSARPWASAGPAWL